MKKTWVLAILIFGTSCFSEIRDTINKTSNTTRISWAPEIAFPLLYSEVGIEDLVQAKGDLVDHRVENDKSITLVYESKLFSLKAEDVFELPDQQFNEYITLNSAQQAALIANGEIDIQIDQEIDFNYGANELDSIIFKSGSLDVDVRTSLRHNVNVTATVLHSSNGGNTLDAMADLQYSGSVPQQSSTTEQLNNAVIDFTQGSQGHSQFVLRFDVHIETISGNSLGAADYVNIDVGFNNMEFRYVKGFLSATNISNGNDSLFISLFKNDEGGSFTLVDPKLIMRFKNGYGMDIVANLTRFEGRNRNGNVVSLTGFPSPYTLNAAPVIGGLLIDSVVLDRNTSNLAAYIQNAPYTNVYEYTIQTGNNNSSRMWILDTSVVECEVQAEIPLWGTARDYEFELTSALELDQEFDDYIESALFRLNTRNGFPVDVVMQMYFEDSVTNTIIDSLFTDDPLVLEATQVDGNGRSIDQTYKTIDSYFDSDRLTAVKQANRARYRFQLNTSFVSGSQPDVKIFEDYNMLVQFGIQAKMNIDEEL